MHDDDRELAMAQFFPRLDDALKAFIAEQHMFFVATAPGEGRVNLSPKGMDTFRVIDDSTACYLDLTGSGNETAAHLRDNGRITVMWCSFGGTAFSEALFTAIRHCLAVPVDQTVATTRCVAVSCWNSTRNSTCQPPGVPPVVMAL